MQFHPVLDTLYFSNNGRDNIGGDVPDDYIAYAPVAGLNFGYPYCHRQVAVRSNSHVGITMPHICHDQPLPLIKVLHAEVDLHVRAVKATVVECGQWQTAVSL